MNCLKKLSVFILILIPILLAANQPVPYQSDFPPEEFKARWNRIFDRMDKDALAIVQGAPGKDRFRVFRQSNQFYYLCGLETPGSILVLDNKNRTASLYLPRRDDAHERSEGKILSFEDGDLLKQITGVHGVYSVEILARHLTRRMVRNHNLVVYTPFSPAEGEVQSRDTALGGMADIAADPWDGRPSREAHFVSLMKNKFPQVTIKNLSPILDELRMVKSPREIQLIREASRIACLGIMEAMRSTRPGIMEYQLDAAARFVFRNNGARGAGYTSITAGGTNAWMGHYSANSSPLKNGDLVLMDFAPDVRYYTSDVTRMWPVNGRFSASQRQLCGFILGIHDALLNRIRPGVTTSQIYDEAFPEMEKIAGSVNWSKKIYREAAQKAIRWRGHLTHPVGMTVHDVGNYKTAPLKPGIVIALDPMMWVPEEKLYIRIENLVVVTQKGVENLSGMVPSDLDEIEKLIRETGLVQIREAGK